MEQRRLTYPFPTAVIIFWRRILFIFFRRSVNLLSRLVQIKVPQLLRN
jgi:hypothetical protein